MRTEFHYQTSVVSLTTHLSNMSGRYSGLQQRICQLNEFAVYVPCAGHNPNLVGVKAEGCCLEIVKFLDFIQRLYLFLFLGFYTSM